MQCISGTRMCSTCWAPAPPASPRSCWTASSARTGRRWIASSFQIFMACWTCWRCPGLRRLARVRRMTTETAQQRTRLALHPRRAPLQLGIAVGAQRRDAQALRQLAWTQDGNADTEDASSQIGKTVGQRGGRSGEVAREDEQLRQKVRPGTGRTENKASIRRHAEHAPIRRGEGEYDGGEREITSDDEERDPPPMPRLGGGMEGENPGRDQQQQSTSEYRQLAHDLAHRRGEQ